MAHPVWFSAPVFALLLQVASGQTVGPMVGQVSGSDARFLYRPNGVVQDLKVSVLNGAGAVVGTDTVTTNAASDYTAHFHVTGLSASTLYRYRIEQVAGDGSTTPVVGGDELHQFRTFPAPGERGVFTAAFASCANATSEPVWARIDSLNVNALFLMGDTPYIDTSVLATVRQKHRDFLNTPSMAGLIRHVPTTGTWDDHDFGLNGGNGFNVTGKAVNRQAFVEYRALNQYGNGSGGVYNTVACGPMEVFLLDDRWFSQTATSPIDPNQPTCFGADQWTWLLNALKQSRSPFKVLAFGAIWQDKKNGESDDMQTYWAERDALLDYVRDQKIPGVVLLGGDIHVSRHLTHAQRTGYDVHDFVTSPAHSSVIPSLDVYNPDLEWSSQADRQFMTISVDTRVQPAVMTAKFIKQDGTVQRTVTIPYDKLVPRTGSGLAKDLRAYWSFDSAATNQSVLGSRLDATATSGAVSGASGGIRNGAASFNRANSQYFLVPRSVLPENSARSTVSLWCKPTSLPAHGTADKSYLIETTPAGAVSSAAAGYGLSLGIGAGTTSDKVAFTLYTFTLKPAVPNAGKTTSPTEIAQGPFNVEVDRNLLLNQWSNLTFTFDSNQLQLFVNGQATTAFPLPTPGPLSENGGLVIGGHRAGTGRNFDGLIDEVAIWSRKLDSSEISGLWNGGTPQSIPTTVAAVDSDNDGLPDWWEITNGLNPQNAGDAILDTDGDKVPAFIEYSMGTSPLHDDSTFYNYIRQIASPGSSTDSTTFKDPGSQKLSVQLQLETSTDMANWVPVPLGSPETGIESLDSLLKLKLPPSGGTQRFYRFKAKAPQN